MVRARWSRARWNRAQGKFREGRRPGRYVDADGRGDNGEIRLTSGITVVPRAFLRLPRYSGIKRRRQAVVVTSAAEYLWLSQGLLSILQLSGLAKKCRSRCQGSNGSVGWEDCLGAVCTGSYRQELIFARSTDTEFHCLGRSVL